ncbi:MAG: Gfo/Idh/MocA family oxidoreductase [Planctomycetes bacterium]|nr:Gfo/Idh/MocA family oxidoreductase [Planctomycetota bacterium]MBM4078096.1 Gfo/Idh/MocA family oxidoreductase [Planctomycetota bacterium]MBM4083203.1 Gfo/Idh/MocA family oxidoreductase [Planctomycetota bacterium]
MSGKVRIGVVGLGGRGVYLGYRAFAKNPRAELVAACDCDTAKLDAVRQKFGEGPKLYDSLDAMLAAPNMEAVVVATPDHAHSQNAVAALNAGKHVFLEKPMAQTIADCDAILDAWRKAQTVLLVGLELRYCSLCQEMRRLIDRGDIGSIKLGYAVDNVSVGGQYYYHGRRRRKDYIVSLMLEKGTHTLDLVNWYVGSQPVRVFATGGLDVFGGKESNDKQCRDCPQAKTCPYFVDHNRFKMDYGAIIEVEDKCVYAKECEVEDNCIAVIDYENGARMTYTECHFTPDYTREFTFIGDKGRLYGFYNNEQEFRIRVTYRHAKKADDYFPPKMPGGHGGGDPRIQEEFLDRVLSGQPSMSGALDARNSAAIAIAANESIETRQPVDIPAYAPERP